MKPEYKTTEFWAVIGLIVIWLVDRRLGTNILDAVDIEGLTEVKAKVVAIAGQLQTLKADSGDLILYLAALLYGGRKAEKVTNKIKGDRARQVDNPPT